MGLFSKKKQKNKKSINRTERVLPKHIGIIMDGNGRWAQKRGLPRTAGHTVGAKKFKEISKYCNKIGIKYLTVYAFSTENWRRPADEVNALMKLFKEYLKEAIDDFMSDSIKINFIGDLSVFDDEIKSLIKKTQELAKDKKGMILNIAMNYGSRNEIVRATKIIAREVKSGKLTVSDINEESISKRLYTSGQPDLDLVIRPSGEYRISNFLLWQSAYAEYIIMDILWPDFTYENLEDALDEFSLRNRRFGGI